jgi:hypothetical protein
MQHPDRLGPRDRVAVAVAAPAHVDDRDVEGADIADEVQRLVPRRRLVDDEAFFEGAPDPDPDEGMAVDDQAMWGLAQDCFPIRWLASRDWWAAVGSRAPILPSRRVR